MITVRTFVTLCTLPMLTACLFETTDQKVTRLTQFNGKTVAQVSQIIGKPTEQTTDSAIWAYSKTTTTREPVYEDFGVFGGLQIVYYDETTTTSKCTYTANLSKKRITSSLYDGNSCKRFAPKSNKR